MEDNLVYVIELGVLLFMHICMCVYYYVNLDILRERKSDFKAWCVIEVALLVYTCTVIHNLKL